MISCIIGYYLTPQPYGHAYILSYQPFMDDPKAFSTTLHTVLQCDTVRRLLVGALLYHQQH